MSFEENNGKYSDILMRLDDAVKASALSSIWEAKFLVQ